MGGNIMIESEVNVGTKVIFTCKLAKSVENNTVSEHFPIVETAKENKVLLDVSILLAEDNEFNQQLMLKLLEGHGAICTIAKDGKRLLK